MKQSITQLTGKHCYPPLVVDKLALSFLLLETYITHTHKHKQYLPFIVISQIHPHTHGQTVLLEGIKTEMYPSTLVLPPGEPQSFVLACIPKEPGLLSILGTIIVINQCPRKVFQTVYMYSIVCTIVHIIPLLPLLCKLILLLSVCIINSSSHKVKVHYSSHYYIIIVYFCFIF